MNWSETDKLTYLLRLPWTIVPQEGDEPGDLAVACAELPEAIGVGVTEAQVTASFWASMRLALRSYLRDGDPIRLPTHAPRMLPWEADQAAAAPAAYRVVMTAAGAAKPQPAGDETGAIDDGVSERVLRDLALT